MSASTAVSACAAQAARVLALLETLEAELDTAANPHRVGLRQLGLSGELGWVTRPYEAAAFETWSALQRRQPKDLETLHHLAIMHHARAMDREAGKTPAKANDDWDLAMRHWYTLWQSEAFWERIAATTITKIPSDEIRRVRDAFPAAYLEIHYEIAFDTETPVHRAKFHMTLAHQTLFPTAARDTARARIYERFTSVIPSTVWDSDQLNPDTIKVGTDRIEHYLERDPGCPPALKDALRLQVRLIRARSQDLQALDPESPKRTQLLNTLRQSADHWRPYFDQLVAMRELDDDTRQSLAFWYRIMGDVRFALGQHEHALGLYEQGVACTHPDLEEYDRCRNEVGQTYAYIARAKVVGSAANARDYCDRVRSRTDLNASAHFMLSNAYLLLEAFDAAEEVCRRGIDLDARRTDFDAVDAMAHDRPPFQEMLESIEKQRREAAVHALLDRAQKEFGGQRTEAALTLLDEAIGMAPDIAIIYAYRCRCHLALEQIEAATRDLGQYKRLAQELDDTLVRDLERTISEAVQHARVVEEFGGPVAFDLEQQAVRAYNDDRHDAAIALLRRALAAANRQQKLREELSKVLALAAVAKLNQTKPSQASIVMFEAERMLAEAVDLDARNADAAQYLERVRGLLERL